MKPYSNMDKVIGDYIGNHPSNNFRDCLSGDERLEVATYLSELANGLFGWYPFHPGGTMLQIGSWFGAFTEMLSFRCKDLVVVESDPYRSLMTEKRLNGMKNLRVVNQDIIEYCACCEVKFDYIIFAVDEKRDVIPDVNSYHRILEAARSVLSDKGKLLLAFPNRLGVKYLCGVPDPNTKIPFDGMTEDNSGLYRFDRKELLAFVKEHGYAFIKIYYPMPDHRQTQMIYTDSLRPGADILERIHVYKDDKTQRLMDEWSLMGRLAKNGVFYCFCNAFIVEAGNTPCSEVVYSALSVERGRSRAFATNIYAKGMVEKVPVYPEGYLGIQELMKNTNELALRGIPVLGVEERDHRAVMKQVRLPSLSQYLSDVVKKDVGAFWVCIDRLREYIWNSSEYADPGKNCMLKWASDEDWGVILEKAYIEMIPVNSFYDHGDILFFDQEFSKENCPANYVLYRALRDLYAFSPEIEHIVSLDSMKERYGLAKTWNFYEQEEDDFQAKLRRRDIYIGFFPWIQHLFGVAEENRKRLDAREKQGKLDAFNVISNLDGRRIVLFGSGRLAGWYLNMYGNDYPPIFLVDNHPKRWGCEINGFEIRRPDSITRLMQGTYRVIIAIKDFESVVEQLKQMGIGEDSYRIFDREIDALLGSKINDGMSGEKYHIGYVMGSFDSFGINDLSLLKSSKANSHYLIAGVLTDELMSAELFAKYGSKKLKNTFEERFELVKQCKYVDRVIPVDSHNFDVINAWKELRFGCLFVQKEHENFPERIWLGRKLNTLGSNIEYV